MFYNRVRARGALSSEQENELVEALTKLPHQISTLLRAEQQYGARGFALKSAGCNLPGAWLKLPLVYRAVLNNVETDMTGQDLLMLAPTLYRTGTDSIEHRVIDREMTRPWTTPTGGAVLLPQWETISPLVQELFAP